MFCLLSERMQRAILRDVLGDASELVGEVLESIRGVSLLTNVNLTYHRFFNRPILPTCHQLTNCLHILWHPLNLRR